MALIFVDHFVYASRSYNCFYDTGSNSGVVQSTGAGTEQSYIAIPNSGRSYTEGQPIKSFCSDSPNTTKVNTFASAASPFFTWSLVANSSDCPTGGGGGGCDVVINSINVTNESSTGANDGTATVNASSTPGGLTYSIGGAYQSSNIFTNLAPGNYTIAVKDANNCTTSQPITILSYANPVVNFTDGLPVVTVPTGNISKWSAAFNPIILAYQRKDFTITNITQSGSQIKVQLSVALTFAQYTLAISNGTVFKSPKYDVTAKPVSYDTSTGFTFNSPYLGDDTSGYLNIPDMKPNYFIQTEITSGNNPVTKDVLIAEHSPNAKGATNADLSPYLQTLLSPRETYDYLQTSYRDYNLAGSYTIRYREVWDGTTSAWYSAPYPLYYTYAAKQLGEKYGGNMGQYVPFMSVASLADKAKFLTDFDKPTYWTDLPFDLSFIYSEAVINQQLYIELTPDCGPAQNGLLLNADAGYLTSADSSRFIINRVYNPNIQGYPIIASLGVNRVVMPNVFDCCAKNIKANIYYNSNGGQATFNNSLNESTSPAIDANCQIKSNGVIVSRITGNGPAQTGTVNAGDSYSFEAFEEVPSGITNAKIRMTITRTIAGTSVVIFDKQIAANTTETLLKTGIWQKDASYSCVTASLVSTATVTPVNVDDNTPLPAGTKVYVMQDLNIKHECPCGDPYVYLKWINSRGAWDYWRFGYNQSAVKSVNNSELVEHYITDYENQQTVQDVISRSANKKVTLVAGQLTTSQLNGLSGIAHSRRIQMLVSRSPVKWQTVILPDGDFNLGETRGGKGDVKLTITLPSINIQHG